MKKIAKKLPLHLDVIRTLNLQHVRGGEVAYSAAGTCTAQQSCGSTVNPPK